MNAATHLTTASTAPFWGSNAKVPTQLKALGSLGMILICPIFTLWVLTACTYYECSLVWSIRQLLKTKYIGLVQQSVKWVPKPTRNTLIAYSGWVVFQGILYKILPGKTGFGQMTPAGYCLSYKFLWGKGLRNAIGEWSAGVYTYPCIILCAGTLWSVSCISNICHFFSFIKAHLFPSHSEDCKFSGSLIYDFWMGIELNPRFGNGRPGIICWTLIDISFAAAQRQRIGYITNSMYLIIFLHGLYVLDFFYHEDWYLRTIDICHDRFGFYLAWGDTVWLPMMYTLQAQYLYRNPVDLHPYYAVIILKDHVRLTDGNCKIWGKSPKLIRTTYTTLDGKIHKSILLCSGYWGLARQFNYIGDLLLAFSMCAACGFKKNALLAYFYIIYMFILLNHRVYRTEKRCSAKYGHYWKEYCKKVPYRLFPGIY
ncbi:unnamed protein product [Pneumocystis jirovecii]|uniref:7-dehydrocholesterol reductase n=1 Tax=Pneumocystis jirovecii TaxID=42068 RepID=L0PAW2_PNEJI|nr:unnamed protein product [Pneumocystis jirovecii]